MQLHAINKEKPTEKFVDRERKTTVEKRNEKYPETDVRARDDLVTGNRDLHGLQEHPGLLELSHVTGGETVSCPASGLLLLRCGIRH
jgi:hypothetical protein